MTKSINETYGELLKTTVDMALTASAENLGMLRIPFALPGAVIMFCAIEGATDTILLSGRSLVAHGVFANLVDDGRFGCWFTIAGRDGGRAQLEHFHLVWFARDKTGRNTRDEAKMVGGTFLRLVGLTRINSVQTRVVPAAGGKVTIEVVRPAPARATTETYYEGEKIEI